MENATCLFLLVLGVAISRLRFPIYHIRSSSDRTELIKPDQTGPRRPRRVGSFWSIYIYVDPCRQLRRSCCLKRKMSSICLLGADKTPPAGEVELRWDKVTKEPVSCPALPLQPTSRLSTLHITVDVKKKSIEWVIPIGYRFEGRIPDGDNCMLWT